jgi:hypothetical protein
MPSPGNGDPCQCIRGTPSQSTTTTKAPTYTTKAPTAKPAQCWTCPAGYLHCEC